MHGDPSAVGVMAVFPEIDSLPRAQREPSVPNRDGKVHRSDFGGMLSEHGWIDDFRRRRPEPGHSWMEGRGGGFRSFR
jgi:hypothetical protein